MRTRILLVPLFLVAIGFILAYRSPVMAQGGDPVDVLRLSDTGIEQGHSVAFSAAGKQLAVGGMSGVYLFNTADPSDPDLIQTGAWVHSVAFVPGADSLAAGLFDNTVKIWTGPSHQLLRTLDGPQGWVRSISFSRDGHLVAAASDDNAIHIWASDQGSTLLTLNQDITGIRSVALSPDGNLVAAALGDKTVRVWTVPDGKLLYTLTGHGDWVRCVMFSPDGRILASSGFDMTVRLWDMANGRLLRSLAGHTSSILGLSFSPDGSILASGSTDMTIRLWRVKDGAPLQILRGHTGFVYSVAFSPDGKTLASGASDNTVRLWKVDAWLSMPAPRAVTGPVESTTKDCRLCHHRQGSAAPPRVLEIPCEACHAGGIGLSWCAAFPRSAAVGPLDTTYHAVDQVSGVPTGDSSLSVLIASPANGETLYVRGNFMAPEVISGKVYAADSGRIQDIKLRLQIIADGQPPQSLMADPNADGTFHFNAAINPNSPPPHLLKPSTRQCLQCHGDYKPEAGLPVGIVRLVVTATTPGGQQATDGRWIHVDSSRDTSVPVRVIESHSGQAIPGISITASTILYQWRDRFNSAFSNGDGSALLTLDDSSQVPTTYNVSVLPQVINGVLYSSEPVAVKLQPGAHQATPVVLRAVSQRGMITGTLEGARSLAKLWAIQLPSGPAFQVAPSEQNRFAFAGLPIGSYIITPEFQEMAQQGLSAALQHADLLQSPHSTLTIPVTMARTLSGTVIDERGQPVPFAWIELNGQGNARPVDAATGQFVITDLPANVSFITVNASGFYSQSLHVSAGQKTIDFHLVADRSVRSVPWGSGQIVLSAQANRGVEDSRVTLDGGWMWGSGGDAQPLTVVVGGAEITIPSAEFAIENAAGQTGWLYLRHGQADIQFVGQSAVIHVASGRMMALVPAALPVQMDETVVLSLHPAVAESPVSEHLQPGVSARLRDSLEKAGIGSLQTITFITYILSLVALITIPLFVLFSIRRRKRAAVQEKP